MEEFIKELEEKLNENNISNVELIVAKYRKRYEFGLESGLSDDEIKSMLGSVEEIVNLYKNNNEFEESVLMAYNDGVNNIGGGAVGTAVAYPLIKLIGKTGTAIFAIGIGSITGVF